jgi:uncharacterized SAM-binding protein YcdF (DUF218 family)
MKVTLTASVIVIFVVVFLWILTGQWMADGVEPKANGTKDYAIILGAKVNGEIPSLSLQYRLDAALEYAKQYPHVYLILSGGQGAGEHISEAEAMKRFLIEKGIQEERLLFEGSSTSTYENLLYSIEMIPDSVEEITIISSDYHLARAKNIARSLGFQTDVVSAKTPKVVELKLRTRERLALIKTIIVGR